MFVLPKLRCGRLDARPVLDGALDAASVPLRAMELLPCQPRRLSSMAFVWVCKLSKETSLWPTRMHTEPAH